MLDDIELREIIAKAPYKWYDWYQVSTDTLKWYQDRYLDQIYRKDYANMDNLEAIDFELARREEHERLMAECPF